MNYYKWNDDSLTEDEWIAIIEGNSSNYTSYFENEYRRISDLNDEERELQLRQLNNILNEMNRLDQMERDRIRKSIREELVKHGAIYKNCAYTSEELKNKWRMAFLPNITAKEKNEIYLDEYLWHAFTYHKIDNYMKGHSAMTAFNAEKKDEIYLFWQGNDEIFNIETNNQITTNHLRLELSDLYVVDSNFTWTYILKHCDNEPIWYKKIRDDLS